jgi:CRISPR-associated protein Cmr5
MAQTLEQLRAADAWERSQGCSSEYVNLAKGLPALIMNSGLMQVMAFLEEKGSSRNASQQHCAVLGAHLRQWLHRRFPEELPSADFAPFMTDLMKCEPGAFRLVTAEAFAWLRWIRQVAPAVRTQGR